MFAVHVRATAACPSDTDQLIARFLVVFYALAVESIYVNDSMHVMLDSMTAEYRMMLH